MKRLLLTLLGSLLLFTAAMAQAPWPDSTALDSYMDGLVNSYMQENDIAGATVGIVKDGEPVFLKGYGHADLEINKKVNSDSTLFRIGSISKMFVWTAVMQLAEQGKLDLDEGINKYIEDFQIPDTFEEPITLNHLMTHTAGFEEYFIGLFARDTTRLRPLGEILSDEMPARVRPPAEYSSYSNHGTGMAAYIVEQVSGQSFEEYVEEHILSPLNMNRTTFRQPVPDHLEEYLSNGYSFEGGEFRKKNFEYVPLGPVGAASATAADMINFMQAHLQYGQLDDSTILDSTTAREMQRPAFRHHPKVNPMWHGFIDMSQNGVEIIGHGGDTFWFHSSMALFPEHDLGLFISFNSAGGSGTYGDVLRDFVDHYFPERNLSSDTLQMSQEELNRFAGNYRANRYPNKRFTYVMALLGSSTVDVASEDTLKTMDDGKAKFWIPVDSLTFRNTESSNVIAFEENENGKITHMFRDNLPIMAFEKVPFISSQKLHFTLFGLAGGAFLLTLIYWPLAFGIRRRYQPESYAKQPISFDKKTTAWCNALVILIFFVWIGVAISGSSGRAIAYGISTSLKVAFALPLISMVLTVAMGYYTFKIWRQSESGIWSRIWYSLLFLFSVTMLWQLNYWNLLGFQF